MEHVECEYLVLMSKPWAEVRWARIADSALGGGHGRQRPVEHGDRDRLGVFAHRTRATNCDEHHPSPIPFKTLQTLR